MTSKTALAAESGMLLDAQGVSHGSFTPCGWELSPHFVCCTCKRKVCPCAGHGCDMAMGPKAKDYCDDCCPCDVEAGR